MKKITYDMFDHMDLPVIVLSTRYHKHLGEITNVFNHNVVFNMQSFQEVSFDVYKFADGKECKLWDDIVDFKYIYIPEYSEYYEIYVKTDETNNTVKHVTAKSAAEVELSNRMLYDFHCNDETDITFEARYSIRDNKVAYEPVVEGYYYNGKFYEDASHTKIIAPATGTIYEDLITSKSYRWIGTGYDDVTGENPQPAYNKNGVVDFEYDTKEEDALIDEGQSKKDLYKATVIYRPIGENDSDWLKMKKMRSSLLHRVLHDKYPEWKIAHVDNSLMNMQRTFTADKTNPYTFLTNTVAQEIDGLFVFDSVNRTISLYDLDNICKVCGHRGNFVDYCPKCGNTEKDKMIEGYGKNTGIYISTENFAEQISIDGDSDNVKSAFRVSGGDDIITAAVRNCNPNGTNYIYHFSDEMMSEMPEELVARLRLYEERYNTISEQFTDLTEQWYQLIDDVLYLKSGKMPDTPVPGNTTAKEQLDALATAYRGNQTIGLKGIEKDTSDPESSAYQTMLRSCTKAVEGMSKAIIDPRYTVEYLDDGNTSISNYNPSTQTRTWTGKFKVKSLGKVDAEGKIEEAVSDTAVTVTINNNEEEYLRQKIQKSLDRTDAGLKTLFDIEDINEFTAELDKYCRNRLSSFESTYQSAMEILQKNNVTKENKDFYHVHLYEQIYEPLSQRKDIISQKIADIDKEIEKKEKEKKDLQTQRTNIQKDLNLEEFLGEELYNTFKLYIRESEFQNSNYISEGLDLDDMNFNTEVINKALELIDVANEELLKAAELQVSLSDNLYNLLNTKEFKNWKSEFEIGDWIINCIDDELYKLRLIGVTINYESRDIQVTFSNSVRYRNNTSDISSILSSAQSIATTYSYTAHQAKQGDEANASIKNMESNGVDAGTYKVKAGSEEGVLIDEHGILCTMIDDSTGQPYPKQLKILNNMIAFTDDNWKTVSTGIGEIPYTIDGVTDTAYGVNAQIMVAGKMIAGDIYSSNYSSSPEKVGTHINLDDGSFTLAGGKIEYNEGTDVLDINVAHINYGSGVNTPTVSQIDGLSTALAAKQDKLTAGTNITIDANNVISATGGGNSNIYFGENVPSDSYGENESIYIQYSYSTPVLSDTDYESDVINLVSFEEQSDGTYDLVVGGEPTAQTADYIEFNLENFIVGDEYTITFDLKFNDEATFPWTHMNDFVSVGSEQVIFESDTVQHSYSITFTAAGNDKLHFQFNRVNDVEYFTATITDLTIIGDGAVEIVDIYGKIQDGWRLYNPSIDVDELSDVEISNLSNGEVLKYDSTLGKWVNDNGGSDISVTPVVLQGTNIADITIDGTTTHLYTPNNGNDIYTGTSEPVVSLGSDGDLYYQYRIEQGGDEIDYEIEPGNDTNMPYTSTTDVNDYGIVVIRISAGRGASWFDTTFEVNIDDIGTDSQNPTVIFTRDTYDGVINLYCYNDNGYLNFSYTFAEGAVLRALGFKVGDTYHKVAIYTKDDGYWKKNIESGGGGTGNVDDVYVNGTSVLDSNHIAQIKSYKELTQAEYDALPSSKLTDDIMYCITDAGVTEGDTFAPIIYSLAEREVGTYADGKPLYEKTFPLSNASVSDSNSVNIPCDLTDIERIIFKSGTVYDVNDQRWYPLAYERKLISENLYLSINRLSDETVSIQLMTNQSATYQLTDIMVTLQYTKTTDTPGSAQYTPLGVPAVHYDNTEKIIGTWFGETLYEKSYEINNPNTTDIVVESNFIIDELINVDGVFQYYVNSSDIRWQKISGRSESSRYNEYGVTVKLENTTLSCYLYGYSSSEIPKIRLTIQYTKTI